MAGETSEEFLLRVGLDLVQPTASLEAFKQEIAKTMAQAEQIARTLPPTQAAEFIGATRGAISSGTEYQVAQGRLTQAEGNKANASASARATNALGKYANELGLTTEATAELRLSEQRAKAAFLAGGNAAGVNEQLLRKGGLEVEAAMAGHARAEKDATVSAEQLAAAEKLAAEQTVQTGAQRRRKTFRSASNILNEDSDLAESGIARAGAIYNEAALLLLEDVREAQTFFEEIKLGLAAQIRSSAFWVEANTEYAIAIEEAKVATLRNADFQNANIQRQIAQSELNTVAAGSPRLLDAKGREIIAKNTQQEALLGREEVVASEVSLGLSRQIVRLETELAALGESENAVKRRSLEAEITRLKTAQIEADEGVKAAAIAREELNLKRRLLLLREPSLQTLREQVAAEIAGAKATEIKTQAELDAAAVTAEVARLKRQQLLNEAPAVQLARAELAASKEVLEEEAQEAAIQARINQLKLQKLLVQDPRVQLEVAELAAAKAGLVATEVQTEQEVIQAGIAAEVTRMERRIAIEKSEEYRLAHARLQEVRGSSRGAGGPGGVSGFLGTNLVRTAGYLASGALLFGGIAAIRESITEATELERIFNQIQSQFDGLGESGSAANFIEQMKDISRETGQATSDVAKVGFQFVGAFDNAARAITETRAASQLSRVTDLPVEEITDSLTALTQSYQDTGLTIREIGDLTLGLQERFGVLAKQTITFAADLAPVAAAAGFTAAELTTLGAVAQKYSGRSGSALAEAFGRIFPTVQENAIKFLNFFKQAVPEVADAMANAFGTGDIQGVLDLIGTSYEKLNGAQKTYLEALLGGSRNAQAIIPVLRNYNELLDANGKAQAFAGKQNEYFNKLQETLSQSISRIAAELKLLGVAIVEAGFADFLKTIIELSGGVIGFLTQFLSVFQEINQLFGGLPGKIVGVTLAILALNRALTALIALQARGGLAGVARGAFARFGIGQAAGAAGAAATTSAASTFASSGFNYAAAGAAGTAATGAAATGLRAAVAGKGNLLLTAGIIIGGQIVGSISDGIRRGAQEKVNKLSGEDSVFQEGELEKLRALAENDDAGFLGNRLESVGRSFGIHSKREENQKAAEELYNSVAGPILAEKLQALLDAELLPDYVTESATTFAGITVDTDTKTLVAGTEEHKKFFDETINLLANGEGDALDIVSKLEELGASNPLIQSIIENFKTQAEKVTAAAAKQQEIGDNIKAAEDAYNAGRISLAQYRTALQNEIQSYNDIEEGPGALDPELKAEQEALKSKIQNVTSSAIKKQLDYNQKIRDLFGQGSALSNLTDLTGAYNELKNTPDVSPDELADIRLDIIGAISDLQKEQVDGTISAVDKIRLNQIGLNVDSLAAGIRFDDLVEQIRSLNVPFQNWVQEQSDLFNQQTDFLAQETAKKMIELGLNFDEAYRLAITEQIARYTKLLETESGAIAASLQHSRAAAQAALGNFAGLGLAGPTLLPSTIIPDKSGEKDRSKEIEAERKRAEEERKREAEALRKAQETYAQEVYGSENPLNAAKLQLAFAERAVKEATKESERVEALTAQTKAQRSVRDAMRAQDDARLELLVARAEVAHDEVEVARLGVEQAQIAVARAEGTGDRTQIDRANATLIGAIENLRQVTMDQVNAVIDAQSNLSIAIAEAAGDSVASAQEALAQAERAEARANATFGAGSAESLDAQAGVIRASAQVRDAQLSEDLAAIDFASQMEEITREQAIEQFKALLAIPGLTVEQTRSLRLKIKSLQKETEGELQLDLPTDIRLPTTYEAFRFNTGYADNRVIQINVLVNGGNPNDLIGQISNAVNGAPRFGTNAPVY